MSLGSVTARHSSIGRQPNFAALNTARHLYSTGRPSRILVSFVLYFIKHHHIRPMLRSLLSCCLLFYESVWLWVNWWVMGHAQWVTGHFLCGSLGHGSLPVYTYTRQISYECVHCVGFWWPKNHNFGYILIFGGSCTDPFHR